MFKISIILPVYNIGEKLFDAFDSIFNQSFGFENLEIIFVVDCSTDDSPNIIKKLSKEYDNVKAICLEENSGYAGKPRNVGMDNATADYLMFLDPDDIFIENACDVLYNNIIDSKCDMVSANYVKYYNGEKSTIPWDRWYHIELKDNIIQVDSIFDEPNLFLCPPSIWTKIFKKEFIFKNHIYFPEGVPGQDLVFFQHCLLKSKGIRFVDIPIVKYIPEHGEENKSVSSNRNKKLLSGYIGAYNESYELLKNYEELVQFSVTHLHYWTSQLSLSDLDVMDKIDLLRLAHPLFEVFKNNQSLRPRRNFEKVFDRIFEKDFIGAIRLLDRLSFNFEEFDEKLFNNIKNSEILLIFDLIDFNSDSEFKQFINVINFLDGENYSVKLLNCNDFEKFYEYKNNFIGLNSSIETINIFNYYSNKNTINNNYGSEESNLLIEDYNGNYIVDNKNNNFTHVKYLNKSKEINNHRKNMVEEEIFFQNSLIYSKFFNNGYFESYYTMDGFNFLKDDFETNKLILFDSHNNSYTYLEDFTDFQNYFVTEFAIKSAKKPFLLCTSSVNLENMDDNILYNLKDVLFENELYLKDSFNDILDQLESYFKEFVYDDFKQEFEYKDQIDRFPIQINTLENKNKNLKNKINQLNNKNNNLNNKINHLNKKLDESRKFNDEILSSKSWKVTKPLRFVMNLFK